MSIGGRSSEQSQYSESSSSGISLGGSSGSTFVDPSQMPFLEQLRQMSMGVYDSVAEPIAGIGNDVNARLTGALDNLGGLANPQQVVDAQLTGLQDGLGEIFQLGMNRIGDNAVTAGAFGGSRQGVAEAALAGEIGDAFTRGYGDIVANASRQSIDANNSVISGAGQLIGNELTSNFAPLQALQGLLGDPTVLSQNESFNFGQTESQSRGEGSGQSAGFGFGFK